MVGNRLVGVITVADPNPDKVFNASDQRRLLLFAQQAAIAVENARLFEAVQRQAREAETLYQATREAAERRSVLYQVSREISSSMQPGKLYEAIHHAVEQLMPCDVFVISLLNDQPREIEAVYLSQKGHRYPARKVSPSQGLSGHVIATGEPLRSGDFHTTHADLVQVQIFGEGTAVPGSVMAVPMRLGGEITGMLSVQSFQPDAYRAVDQEALELMATQAAITLNNARLFEATHRQLEELRILNDVSSAGAAAIQEDSLLEQATQLIGASLFPDNFGILLVDEARGVLLVHQAYRGLPTGQLGRNDEITVQIGEGICGAVALTGEPRRIPDVTQEPAYLNRVPGMISELCVPIKIGKRVIGVVNAESKKPDAYSEADERLLVTFASQLATAIAKVRLFEEVKELSITDPLTGLYNRRHFFEQAEREFARAKRYLRPLAAVMLDLDRFKRVNDTYGHAVGDQVLQAVARICRRELRKIDILARYGGEEFIALLPESELPEAGQVAQRLCDRVAAATFDTNAGPVKLTVSLGIAGLDQNCADLDELLRRADHALYAAKQAGRNRTSAWSGE
jgi:diguanylate cyclase (GGDEF)-like protein